MSHYVYRALKRVNILNLFFFKYLKILYYCVYVSKLNAKFRAHNQNEKELFESEIGGYRRGVKKRKFLKHQSTCQMAMMCDPRSNVYFV